MTKETIKAGIWGLAMTLVMAILIVAGSRRLKHFDAAFVAYTFATLFAVFGITYGYSMWLHRAICLLLNLGLLRYLYAMDRS